ncbi:MAG TPA: hypothetical protein VJO52_07100 [Gemmatimonadaceae bacterium]|nr:hypothetical protein [Gemmatimonadaceae bacterium]
MTPDPLPGAAHPTAHALRVFGGALGMVLIVAGICIAVAQVGGDGCARCHRNAVLAGVAVVVGIILVRGAWRAMRTGSGARTP